MQAPPHGHSSSVQHSPGARQSFAKAQQYSPVVQRVTHVPSTHSPQTETQSESPQHSGWCRCHPTHWEQPGHSLSCSKHRSSAPACPNCSTAGRSCRSRCLRRHHSRCRSRCRIGLRRPRIALVGNAALRDAYVATAPPVSAGVDASAPYACTALGGAIGVCAATATDAVTAALGFSTRRKVATFEVVTVRDRAGIGGRRAVGRLAALPAPGV